MMRVSVLCLLLLISSNANALFEDEEAREQIAEMEKRIATMEETLKSQALLELYSKFETLNQELERLRGQVEELTNENELLQKRQKDFYIDLDTRVRQIEDPDAPLPTYNTPIDDEAELSTPASKQSNNIIQESATSDLATEGDTDNPATGLNEKEAYDAAYLQFINGDYTGAISQFEAFLHQHPQSSLAPSATYWIGNAHYALRDFKDAIEAQQNLINSYPDSPKVPDALLNIASSQNEMANRKAARKTLENLIAKYPFSNAAEKAKQRLSKL